MLYIRTGKPGHGKTLNTIREVDEKALREGRVVYFHNVAGLKPELLKASWFEFEDPHKWFELPENAIIVVDEAQGWFGIRDPRQKPPEYVSRFETMRHHGHEVHLVTQDPRYIDVHLRRLCNGHIHYWRVFKSQQLLRFESEAVVEKVEVKTSFKDSDKTHIKLDKKYFGVYRSTNAEHHFKFKPSKKFLIACAVLIVVPFVVFRAYSRYLEGTQPAAPSSPRAADASAAQKVQSAVSSLINPVGGTSQAEAVQTPAQYFAKRLPRIPDVPSTAPIYDGLSAPVSHPKLYCVSTTDPALVAKRPASTVRNGTACQCYSQQVTKIQTAFDFCMSVAQDGYFDPTIPDRGQLTAQIPPQSPGQPSFTPSERSQPTLIAPRLTQVPYEKGKFLW